MWLMAHAAAAAPFRPFRQGYFSLLQVVDEQGIDLCFGMVLTIMSEQSGWFMDWVKGSRNSPPCLFTLDV
jgi:hypothetical protein